MAEFAVDMRDIRFNLFDYFQIQHLHERCGAEPGEFDVELCRDILEAAEDQAVNLLAPLNERGDREGLSFENGRVGTPKGWRAAYKTYSETGWNAMAISAEQGGQGLPRLLYGAAQEMFIGANLSFLFTPGLTTAALDLLISAGTSDQLAIYLEPMLSGVWSGTMCLTEPAVGTAVPDLLTRAVEMEGKPDHFLIKGQKIFISAGDHDLTDNIVHMVLARVNDDAGVSLFIVPKLRLDAHGGLEDNDVVTIGIEEKLGIHASPTCQLSFGDRGDCQGWLLGDRGRGLQAMFVMMNEARIAVGMQGVGLASNAYLRALAYAKERVQGTRIEDIQDASAERVAIVDHPDVRRNLLHMKALAEGSRALTYYAAMCADRVHWTQDEKEAQGWHYQLEILTPIVKAWCSDESFKAAELSVQVHGGYGYIREYGVEQILRDAKIGSIYEGTNGIQALDLIGRKIGRRGGAMMLTMLNEVNRFMKKHQGDERLAADLKALSAARDAVAGAAMSFGNRNRAGDQRYPALHATPFLQMFGDLLVGWLLLDQGVLAEELLKDRLDAQELGVEGPQYRAFLESDAEAKYLAGKMATARFFVHQIMPRVRARHASIKSEDRSALEVVL